MFCRSCGKEIPENTAFCPYCGTPLAAPVFPSATVSPTVKEDKASVGLIILSFLIPIVGWILYFTKKAATPKAAKQYCTWAWVGFAFNAIVMFASA